MILKSKAEQKIEILEAIQRQRALTPLEAEDLRRSLHAVYMKNWTAQRRKREAA
jgi:acid stress-induced BolA-like protein IbaG/YrbA